LSIDMTLGGAAGGSLVALLYPFALANLRPDAQTHLVIPKTSGDKLLYLAAAAALVALAAIRNDKKKRPR
jgi:hypothetical protein